MEGDELVITADAYAKSVEITSPDSDFILDDNYFDTEPKTSAFFSITDTPLLRTV
ncbi:MAG: hypothetical protein IKA78_05760 [Oscillospiraceae bacterium]|nr:hypothetical protein [Oscillospiraceae bacterium]